MNISRKLLIIICLTVIEVSITVWAALEISKGAKFHQLNFLHLKYDTAFSKLITSYEKGMDVDLNELTSALKLIKQQPIDCLKAVNVANKIIMKFIGTYKILSLCEKDIKYVDIAANDIDQYSRGEINRLMLINNLRVASDRFSQNSIDFEKPVEKTVSFILATLIPAIIIISLLNIIFIAYLSRTITGSIKNLISLLSNKSQGSREIEVSVTGELKELLTVAKLRIKNDLLNVETSQELQEIVEERTHLLQQANDELAQFAYRASHDLKAPLSSSKSLLNFIHSDIEDGELDEAKANVKKTYQQLDKLERLVTDILSLTQAELGSDQREEIDINDIVADIKQRLSWMVETKECVISTNISLNQPIYAEKVRFLQILENMISNGVKYAHVDRIPEIKVSLSLQKEMICLQVEDNGVGIPEENWPDMFKLFQRFHPSMSSGSGLGMSIVKKHIDCLGGKIQFESSDKGTFFTIMFEQDMLVQV